MKPRFRRRFKDFTVVDFFKDKFLIHRFGIDGFGLEIDNSRSKIGGFLLTNKQAKQLYQWLGRALGEKR